MTGAENDWTEAGLTAAVALLVLLRVLRRRAVRQAKIDDWFRRRHH